MILLYHHIAPMSEVPSFPIPEDGWKFTISPEGFNCHLSMFIKKGYRFITLTEMVETISKTGKEPRKAVSITFDDGWIDNYEYAYPILRDLNIPACFFVTSEHFATSKDDRKMSPAHLREIMTAGMEIGSHTINHPKDLRLLNDADLIHEIVDSKSEIEKSIGGKIKLFAYPGGAFNQKIADIVRDAEYQAACSVLGPALNDRSSMYWLYRSTFTEGLNALGDHYRLSPFLVRALQFRVKRRLTQIL